MRRPLVPIAIALVLSACSVPRDVLDAGPARSTTTTGRGGGSTTVPTTTPGGGSSSTVANGSSATTAFTPAPLKWQSCGQRLQCARLVVPLDYADASKGTISLNIKKHTAAQSSGRIGSLLVNPGGPGAPGTDLARDSDLFFSRTLNDRFDIVGWDPRGTGDSSPVDCVDDLDRYLSLDPTPDDATEREALVDAGKEWDAGCEQRSGAILPHISTQDSAMDMHSIRLALHEDKVTYFGFSYGSELGATYATMFPGDVRAMVIDGAADPTDTLQFARESAVGTDRTFAKALDACSSDPKCPFGNGDAAAAFDRLWAKIDSDPVPVSADGRPAVGQGVAAFGIVSALYDRFSWPSLYAALAAMEQGNGDPMLDLYDEYLRRKPDGSWDNLYESFFAITCIDHPGYTDPADIDRFAMELGKLAPRLGQALSENFQCAFWPVKQKPPIAITGKGAGPILVVGTLGDPVTPIESTRQMAAALEKGVLVTVDADRHTGYGANDCIVNVVDGYLTDLDVPTADTAC